MVFCVGGYTFIFKRCPTPIYVHSRLQLLRRKQSGLRPVVLLVGDDTRISVTTLRSLQQLLNCDYKGLFGRHWPRVYDGSPSLISEGLGNAFFLHHGGH